MPTKLFKKGHSGYWKGKEHSKETKKKISESLKGHKASLDTRKKISELKKGNKYNLGKHHSLETRKKIGEGNKGKKRSKEFREKISQRMKGKTPWNKGINKIDASCTTCGKIFAISESKAKKQKYFFCSVRCHRMWRTTFIELLGAKNKGENNGNWKGGTTSLRKLLEGSPAYSRWRQSIFERDDYTCQYCGKRGGELHAHHMKSFAEFPELRLDLDNGLTLCKEDHYKVHSKKAVKK